MKKLEKLNKKQEEKFAEYRTKWLDIGLSAKRANRAAAKKAAIAAYKEAGLEAPKYFFWFDSPMAGCIGVGLLKNFFEKCGTLDGDQVRAQVGDQVWAQVGAQVRAQVGAQVGAQVRAQVGDQVRDQVGDQVRDQVWAQVGAQVRDQVGDQVRDQVWAQVGDQVWAQVGDQVRAQVRAQVWDQVRAQVGAQVGAQVRAQVRAQVGAQVRDQVGDQVRDQVWAQVGDTKNTALRNAWDERAWFYGAFDAGFLSFYDYFLNVCKIEACERLKPLMAMSKEIGFCWMYKNTVVFTEKPTEIYRNAQNRLHKDGGPALVYADGYALYRLNGIRVDEATAKLKPSEITKDLILKQPNADIRREIVRKVTPEQLVTILDAKVIDEKHGYQLLGIDLGDRRVRPFLKMKNPSIDAIHVEGVRPEVSTVEEAIKYRNNLQAFEMPVQLS
jgi:hypothetical protein